MINDTTPFVKIPRDSVRHSSGENPERCRAIRNAEGVCLSRLMYRKRIPRPDV